MNKNFSKDKDWHSIAAGLLVAALIVTGTLVVKHYQDRKDARREIEKCKFELRDNAAARKTYMATAPEIAQNKHLGKIIDSMNCVNDSIVKINPNEYEKNKKLISHLMWIVNHNDSVMNANLARFDTFQKQLEQEIAKCQLKLK